MSEDTNDGGLRIEEDTSVDDIREYVRERILSPRHFPEHDVYVWNFSTHSYDEVALREEVPNLQRNLYVVPYQVTAMWGYIQRLLPRKLRNAETLAYSVNEERYKAYTNMRRVASDTEDARFRAEMALRVNDEVEGWEP